MDYEIIWKVAKNKKNSQNVEFNRFPFLLTEK